MMIKYTSIVLILFSISMSGQKKKPEPKPITLDDFISRKIKIISTESKGNLFTITGFNVVGKSVSEKVIFSEGEVLADWSSNFKFSLSITTTPIKVRPAQGIIEQKVFTGLTNAGINVDVFVINLDRYIYTGKKSSHRFGVGFFLSPTAEELNPENSNVPEGDKYKQLFISNGISITYRYNELTFSFIPAAWDYSTSSIGESYIYKGKRWWGFGIGINTKLLGI